MSAGASPIRDILLPHSDRTALTQVLVVVALIVAATWLVARSWELCLEREPIGELRPIVTGEPCGMKRSAATYPLGSLAQLPTQPAMAATIAARIAGAVAKLSRT